MANISLYHGSAADIQTFVPRDGKNAAGMDYHGTLATDNKAMAMLYAMKLKEGFRQDELASALGQAKDQRGVDRSDFMITNHVLDGVPCTIIRDRRKFLSELEKVGGGYLYTLPEESFSAVVRPDGAATTEWLSESKELKPAKKERVDLEQVMEQGCQVLFLKEGMGWNEFIAKVYEPHQQEFDAGEKQKALYRKLVEEGVLTNENAARGINDPLGFGHWSAMKHNHPGYRAMIGRSGHE